MTSTFNLFSPSTRQLKEAIAAEEGLELIDGEFWYRLVDFLTAPPLNEFDQPDGPSTLHVELRRFRVLKRTPKGVWLEGWPSSRRFVLNEATKRFACPTIAEALESFIARKKRQIKIYRRRMEDAQDALRIAERAK